MAGNHPIGFIMRYLVLLLPLVLFPIEAGAISEECNNVKKMAACCQSMLKGLTSTLSMSETDLAHQCHEEINGAVDQSKEQRYLGACVPESASETSIAKLFIVFSENNPHFHTRSPRFGMLHLMSFKWPCPD